MCTLGEAWQEIMLACSNRCEIPDEVALPDNSTTPKASDNSNCGSDFAFPFFISFYFLCSFLVS